MIFGCLIDGFSKEKNDQTVEPIVKRVVFGGVKGCISSKFEQRNFIWEWIRAAGVKKNSFELFKHYDYPP